MPFYIEKWYIPVNQQKCAAINYTVSCDYMLYGGNGPLEQSQKLTPNDDITGSAIIKAFVATTVIALVLSCFLILDKIKYHFYHRRKSSDARVEAPFYLQLVHTIESLLQALSDQQLVAGISLLVALNAQACEVSAYHYNLVCTMILLSGITHLNTLINIPDFIFKGKTVATQRLLAILAQLVLSGIVLSARNTKSFPSKASPLAIMPAACFENMNATNSFGLSDFINLAQNATAGQTANSTANATQIWANIQNTTSATSGLGEYITLIVFAIFAIIFLAMEFIDALFFPNTYLHWFSIALSITSAIASAVITAVAMTRYNKLRDGMEVDKWFDVGSEKKWTYSQIVPILLLGSGSITLLKAITESIAGHRARRYTEAAQRAANEVANAQTQVQKGGDEYDLMQRNVDTTYENYQFSKTTY